MDLSPKVLNIWYLGTFCILLLIQSHFAFSGQFFQS